MPLVLTSQAFTDGTAIPDQYTRDGDNLSPPLHWSGAPDETRSYALIVEDPDAPAGTFRHWAIHDIPARENHIPEGAETGPAKYRHAAVRNDFGHARYDGPAPPRGSGPHHYHFRLYALDVPSLALPPEAGAADMRRQAEAHALATAELVGIYRR